MNKLLLGAELLTIHFCHSLKGVTMFTKRTLWLLLGIAGILEMLVISSYLNQNLPALGPAGPMDITLHGNLFAIANVAPVLLVLIVMLASLFTEKKGMLLVATLGTFVVGALLVHYTTVFQENVWGALVGCGIVVYVLRMLYESVIGKHVGIFRKRTVPSTVPEREVAA